MIEYLAVLRFRPVLLGRLLLLCVLLPQTVGCFGDDGGRRKVTGEISFDGQPLEGGWIYFRPIEKGPSSAAQIADGSFAIPANKGPTAGTYKVVIEYLKSTGRMQRVYTGEQIEEKLQIVPPQFNDKSILTADIQASGRNHLTFDLKSK